MTLSITLHNFTLGATTKESLINKWIMKSLNISQNPDCYIIFVKVQMRKGKKFAPLIKTRRRIITHDLDIYKCALQIQLSVVNTNWILQAVFCQSVYCICCPTWPWQNNCWKWHWHMWHWKWYLNFCSSSWKLWWQYIYMGGIEYHITTNLAIMILAWCHYTCGTPKKTLYEWRSDMVVFYEDVMHGTPEI